MEYETIEVLLIEDVRTTPASSARCWPLQRGPRSIWNASIGSRRGLSVSGPRTLTCPCWPLDSLPMHRCMGDIAGAAARTSLLGLRLVPTRRIDCIPRVLAQAARTQ